MGSPGQPDISPTDRPQLLCQLQLGGWEQVHFKPNRSVSTMEQDDQHRLSPDLVSVYPNLLQGLRRLASRPDGTAITTISL